MTFARRLLLVAGIAVAVRLALVGLTPGHPFDMAALQLVADRIVEDPLHLYALNPPRGTPVWPYPPLFGGLAALVNVVADWTGIAFSTLIRVPGALADVALAWLVQAGLGRCGRSHAARLGAFALLALGPVALFDSTVHGQVDGPALLAAFAGFLVVLGDRPNRYLEGGLLFGAAIAIKHPMALILLGVVLTMRNRQALVRLLVPAVAIPTVLTLPLVLAEPAGARAAAEYSGISGYGGLSMLAQPGLAIRRIASGTPPVTSDLARKLIDHGNVLVVIALLVVSILLWRARASAATNVVVLLLTAYATLSTLGPWYFVWVLPFLVLIGRTLWATALSAVLLIPMVLLYRDLLAEALPGTHTPYQLGTPWATRVYAPLMILATLLCAAAVVLLLIRRGDDEAAMRDAG